METESAQPLIEACSQSRLTCIRFSNDRGIGCCFPHQLATRLRAEKVWPLSRYLARQPYEKCNGCNHEDIGMQRIDASPMETCYD